MKVILELKEYVYFKLKTFNVDELQKVISVHLLVLKRLYFQHKQCQPPSFHLRKTEAGFS